jgi:hypothetical protein
MLLTKRGLSQNFAKSSIWRIGLEKNNSSALPGLKLRPLKAGTYLVIRCASRVSYTTPFECAQNFLETAPPPPPPFFFEILLISQCWFIINFTDEEQVRRSHYVLGPLVLCDLAGPPPQYSLPAPILSLIQNPSCYITEH